MKINYLALALLTGFASVEAAAQSALPRKDIPAIAKAANGAIVSIIMSDNSGPIAQGTGFLVSEDGVIVTNYHVIQSGSSAHVKLPDGAFFVVDGVLASDRTRDVAIIKAHGQNFRTLTLGNSDRVEVGEEVVAIGNPLSLESTVSNGIVSGIRTVVDGGGKFLQVTVPISPGSSGGPLFNMSGEVVGITTLYLKGGENLNFAIPVNDAKRLLLVKSSKLQDLPNETEQVKAQTQDVDALPTASETPSLEETRQWMENSLRLNTNRVSRGELSMAFIDSGSGCSVRIETKIISMDDTKRKLLETRKVLFESKDSFNLRDIDPDRISFEKTSQGTYVFTAKTRNDESNIKSQGYVENDIEGIPPHLTFDHENDSINFELPPDYGPRFIKAFKHAVILCGGKPSTF